MIIGDLIERNSNKFPDKEAIVSGNGISMTFRTLNERVNRLSHALLNSGLKKGDRIGVLLHNCHQFIEIYFAAAKTGAVFSPYNNHFKQWELKDILNYSTPRFVVVDPDFLGMIDILRPELNSVEKYICLEKCDLSFAEEYEILLAQGRNEEPDVEVLDDDVLSIFFTGGTTGKPKGAMRTHRHLMSDAVASIIDLKVDYDEKILITFPMFHVAFEDNLVRHSFMPNTFHIRREGGFNPEQVLDYILKGKDNPVSLRANDDP